MKHNILILFILLSFITSCYKDIKVFDAQTYVPKLGLSGIMLPDSAIKIWVYNTSGPGSFSDTNIISNAMVHLYQDNKPIEQLSYKTIGKVGYYESSTPALAGHTYKITVDVNGKQAWAQDSLPAKPSFEIAQLNVIDTSSDYIRFKDMQLSIKAKVKIIVHNTHNYYYAFTGYSMVNGTKIWFSLVSNNIRVTDNSKQLKYISLPLAQGGNEAASWLYTPSFYQPGDIEVSYEFNSFAQKQNNTVTLYFITAKLSKDLYEFYVSYLLYMSSRYNPFVEPVNVKVNVNNGLGLFAGLSFSIDSVKINF